MNSEWLSQTLLRTKQWNAKICVVDWLKPSVNLDRISLDQYIDQVDAYKHDQTTTVAKVDIDSRITLVLKRYNARSFGHVIKRALRKSRAMRCWEMSYVFAQAGLNVATPLFMFEERLFFFRKYAYFANEYLSGDELLKVLPTMEREEQLNVVDALKKAIKIMQQHKISHGDMKASNLLWVSGKLFFIDLDAAQQHNSSTRWQISNRRDRKRFLKNWRDSPDLEQLFSWLK